MRPRQLHDLTPVRRAIVTCFEICAARGLALREAARWYDFDGEMLLIAARRSAGETVPAPKSKPRRKKA